MSDHQEDEPPGEAVAFDCEMEARNYLQDQAIPLTVEFFKSLLHPRTDDVLVAMRDFAVAKLEERKLAAAEGAREEAPMEANVPSEIPTASETTTHEGAGSEAGFSVCTEDFLNPVEANLDPKSAALHCGMCAHLEQYAQELNLQLMRCACLVLALDKESPETLETAVQAAKKAAAKCCKAVYFARKRLEAVQVGGGEWVTKPRGGSTSDSDDSDGSESDDDFGDLPDIMQSAPLKWRIGPRPSVCAESTLDIAGYELPFYKKDSAEREMLERCLSDYGGFLFASIADEAERTKLIDAMKPLTVRAGTLLIRQGDSGDGMYFVGSGTLRVERDGPEGKRVLREVGSGDCIGELAVLYRATRSSNVVAVDECQLWFLERQAFNKLARGAASQKRERYEQFLKSVPLLKTVGLFARGRIADALQECHFKNNEIVIHEGEVAADAFYLIVEGSVTVSKMAVSFAPVTLGPGCYFGEIAILRQCPRQATVTAESDLRLARIERRAFKKVMEDVYPVLMKEMDAYA